MKESGVIITIFKEQFESCPQLIEQLAALSMEVKEISTAILYMPGEANMADFIFLLNQNKISFGAHAQGEELPDVIRWNGLDMPGSAT